MSKKRSFLGLIKKFFFHETHHQQQKITRRRRWLFGRLKRTKTLPSPSPPPPPPTSSTQQPPLIQTTEHDDGDDTKQSKTEEDVVKVNTLECESEGESESELLKHSEIETNDDEEEEEEEEDDDDDDEKIISLISENESTCDQIVAAITIQTAYRCYLAKKALRALKGFVRLQAIIRGTAVRRQAMTTLKCLQSIAKIQSEVRARRCQMIRGKDGDLLTLQDLKNQNSNKIQLCRLRRLDDELLSKEEEIDMILRKKEAILRSKKIKAYSFNHRHSADAVLDGNSQGRLRYWLEQVVSNDVVLKKENMPSLPRNSFHKHRKQNSYGDQDGLHSSSPTNLPTYMAATESAKARTRSTSSPRLRPIHVDAYSDNDSPYKQKLFSPMSSINSEATCSGFSKVSIKSSFSSSHQKSPSFKGVSGPIRSNKNSK